MIVMWDEVSREAREAYGLNACDELPDPESGEGPMWQTEHVIDFPDGMRVVLDRSDRGHLALWVTTPED